MPRYCAGSADVLGDGGWDVYRLMYLQVRLFEATTSATWATERNKLGLGTYATKPVLSGNDYMLMSSSFVLGRDMRPVFDGVTVWPY